MNTQAQPNSTRGKTQTLVMVALFAALTGVLSQLIIPMPWLVPISLGNLAGFFAVGLLSWQAATLSQFVWVLLGAVGAPVFSGFGSLSRLAGPTGGYIIGYVFSALVAGLILSKTGMSFRWMAVAMAAGLVICYLFGTVWFMVVTKSTLGAALLSCVLPYLPGDALKIVLAALVSVKLRPRIRACAN